METQRIRYDRFKRRFRYSLSKPELRSLCIQFGDMDIKKPEMVEFINIKSCDNYKQFQVNGIIDNIKYTSHFE